MKVLGSLILMSSLLISESFDSVTVVQKLVVSGDNSIVTQTFNKGLSSKAIQKFIKPYEDRIEMLQSKISRTVSIEEKYKLSKELNEAKQIMKQKAKEIIELNNFIASTNLEVVEKAKKIYEEKGLIATLDYFKSQSFTKFEKNTQKNMKELSGGYKLYAKFLVLHDDYKDANGAYKKVLQYERSHDNLFEYATFLLQQNLYDEAIVYYKESLKERKKLSNNNPSKYQPLVVTILNNLANLHNSRGQLDIAKSYYEKALIIRKKFDMNEENEYIFLSILNNLGILYTKEKEFNKAKKNYIEALDVCKKLNQKYSNKYELELAITLDNFASLYNIQQKYKDSKNYYMQSLEIYKKLDTKDSKKYKSYLANGFNNLGTLYKSLNQLDVSEEYYNNALKEYEELVKTNPLAYNLYLPIIWNNLAILHKEKSILLFQKSLASYQKLEEEDFARYHKSVSQLENSLKEMNTTLTSNSIFNQLEKVSLERKVTDLNEEINKLENASRVVNNLVGVPPKKINIVGTHIVPNNVESFIDIGGIVSVGEEVSIIPSKIMIEEDVARSNDGLVIGTKGSMILGGH